MAGSEIRTRIAPSPTGPLHVGTARAALFSELFARQGGGSFILRIEDTDRERSEERYENEIKEGLDWLGIHWDEVFSQSERGELYHTAIQHLLASGAAYQEEGSEAVRIKVEPQEVVFNDLVRGQIKVHTNAWGGDFVIARTPRDPLYHLAVVVDDADMQISHVIRGEDHLSNTPRHILLQRALGYKEPKWAHLPLLLNERGGKLSKRDGEVGLLKYREAGFLPEALLNYLALLGWSPGDDREFYTHDELIKAFSLEGVQKGGAVFSVTKLAAFNKHYLRKLSGQELLERARPYLPPTKVKAIDDAYLIAALSTEQERVSTLGEFGEAIEFFLPGWEGVYPAAMLVWWKSDMEKTQQYLQQLTECLEQFSSEGFTEKTLGDTLLAWVDEKKMGRGDVLWPMRVALTGREHSPGPFEVAAVLGKTETIRRLKNALAKMAGL